MNDTSPYVSLFIPTYNDCTDLLPCLESLRRLTYPKSKIEIIIWDNGSRDDTVDMVRKQYGKMKHEGWVQLKLIEWDKNEGSYIPYNLVQEYLSPESEYMLGLDADVELSDNALISLVTAAQKEHIAVVGARSVYYDKSWLTAHGAGFVNQWTGFYSENDPAGLTECDYVIGCCWLLNRSVFKVLGGFDPEYYINHWEVDYCLRAKRMGYRILYEPIAVARHKIPIGAPIGRDRVYSMYRNKILLIKKTFPPPGKWSALAFNLALGLPKAIYDSYQRNKAYDREQIKMILRAFFDGWLNRTGKSV